MKRTPGEGLQSIVEGLVALSSIALVAERVIERVARPGAIKAAPEPARAAHTPIAGDEPTERPSSTRGRPRARARAVLSLGDGGLVCHVRRGALEARVAWTWAEMLAALGPEGRSQLAAELARVVPA